MCCAMKRALVSKICETAAFTLVEKGLPYYGLFGGGLIGIVNNLFTLLLQCRLFCRVMFCDFMFLFNCGFCLISMQFVC